MVSRWKIISRSNNELDTYPTNVSPYDDQDNIWFSREKLFQDHISEILKKWDTIDDEIWAKIIVMERNKRVAKAYARASAISINGSESGFDGYRIGLNGFESESPDEKVIEAKKMIGKGIKIKMDDMGNILIKRLSRCAVIVKGANSSPSGNKVHYNSSTNSCSSSSEDQAQHHHLSKSSSKKLSRSQVILSPPNENISRDDTSAISSEVLKLGGKLEPELAFKLFDMKKFSSNIESELRSSYPDRRRLESQCITIISFIKDDPDILNLPIYILLINIVAIDLLKSKLPPISIMPKQIPAVPLVAKSELKNRENNIKSNLKIRESNVNNNNNNKNKKIISTSRNNNNNNFLSSSSSSYQKLPSRLTFSDNDQKSITDIYSSSKNSSSDYSSSNHLYHRVPRAPINSRIGGNFKYSNSNSNFKPIKNGHGDKNFLFSSSATSGASSTNSKSELSRHLPPSRGLLKSKSSHNLVPLSLMSLMPKDNNHKILSSSSSSSNRDLNLSHNTKSMYGLGGAFLSSSSSTSRLSYPPKLPPRRDFKSAVSSPYQGFNLHHSLSSSGSGFGSSRLDSLPTPDYEQDCSADDISDDNFD